jgi:hypothetical protein
MHIVLVFVAALFTTVAAAQSRGEVTVHPAVPQFGTDPTLLVVSQTGSCDTVRMQVSATAAEVIIRALVTSPAPVVACDRAIRHVKEIVNPRQFFPALMWFANPLAVRYEYVLDGAVVEVQNTSVRFGVEPPKPVAFASGTFIAADTFTSRSREKSGLFIDNQRSAMSATLVDYDAAGKPLWWVAAGAVNGNVFNAEMVTFKSVQCVAAPCSTRVPDQFGSVSAVLLDQDTMLVKFAQVLGNGDSGTLEYKRLRLTP